MERCTYSFIEAHMNIHSEYLSSAKNIAAQVRAEHKENGDRVGALLNKAKIYADDNHVLKEISLPNEEALYLPYEWLSLKKVSTIEEAEFIIGQYPALPTWAEPHTPSEESAAYLERLTKQSVAEINHAHVHRYMAGLYAKDGRFEDAIRVATVIGEIGATGIKAETFCDIAQFAAAAGDVDLTRRAIQFSSALISDGRWIYGNSGNTKVMLQERIATLQDSIGDQDGARERILDAMKICREPLFAPRLPF